MTILLVNFSLNPGMLEEVGCTTCRKTKPYYVMINWNTQ